MLELQEEQAALLCTHPNNPVLVTSSAWESVTQQMLLQHQPDWPF